MLLVTEVVGRLAMLHIECQFEMTGKRREMSLVVLGSAEGEQHEKRRSDILSGAKQICQGRKLSPARSGLGCVPLRPLPRRGS